MPTVSNRYNAATKFHVVANFPHDMVLHVVSEGENGITIEGSQATIFVSRSDLRDEQGTVVADMQKDNPLPEGAITKLYKGKKPGNHMANFFECCKDRTQPISDVATHHRTMTTGALGQYRHSPRPQAQLGFRQRTNRRRQRSQRLAKVASSARAMRL